jgi:hypothetical protein
MQVGLEPILEEALKIRELARDVIKSALSQRSEAGFNPFSML